MDNPAELDKSVLQTSRSQVSSYWQRNLYFVVLETFAMAGFWKLITGLDVPRCIDVALAVAFAVLGIALAVVWLQANCRTRSYYVERGPQPSIQQTIGPEEDNLLRHRILAYAMPILFAVAWLLLALRVLCPSLPMFRPSALAKPDHPPPHPAYFDAHNHGFSAILPYYAYADLPAFIKNPTDPVMVGLEHRRKLWKYLVQSRLGEKSSLTGFDNRYAPGASATLRAYGTDIPNLTPQQINGALQRVLTSTPWTEFDSAYAFRGEPTDAYLSDFFGGNQVKQRQAVCDASIVELAATDTAYSEQFLNFIGGWKPETVAGYPVSSKLDAIRCFNKEPEALAASGQLKGKTVPVIKVLLMTHTSELGATADGKHWMQFGTSGRCEPTSGKSAAPLSTPPDAIRHALLGEKADGSPIIEPGEQPSFFSAVIGIDTAGPEITCFTSAEDKGLGMDNYEKLVRAVYAASRERRRLGWHGKLLVHTHVGEGSATYLLRNIPVGDKAKEVFESFPAVWMDPLTHQAIHIEQAEKNTKMLIRAVEDLKRETGDLYDYVIFRFGHVTNTDRDDALAMKRLNIEADINLESNISTRAFYSAALASSGSEPLTESQQFSDNDIAGKVLASGHAVEILSDHALKNMLAAGVRTLLGSDGGGEENSDIAREYSLAQQLIGFWRAHDSAFPRNISIDTINNNVQEHLEDMQSDRKCGCR